MNNEVDITIGFILDQLKQEGVSIQKVAKGLPNISEKRLRNTLKEIGYEYSNAGKKGWKYTGEGEEPINNSIYEYIKDEFTQSNTEFTQGSQEVHTEFTQEEIKVLRDIMNSWKENAPTTFISNENNLLEDIKQIPKEDKARKTIIISKRIGERVDKFSKLNKIDKSDIYYLALKTFLDLHE